MMKKYFIYLLFFNYSIFIFSNENEDKFLKANNSFEKGEYDQAINLYDSIENKNCSELSNIGNCYYKLGKYISAINYWKKALKIADPGQIDDIGFNIVRAYEKLSKKPNLFLPNRLLKFVLRFLSLIPYFYFQLFFLLIWFLLYIFYRFRINRKIYILTILLFCINSLIMGVIEMKNWNQEKKTGLISKNDTQVYAGPDKAFHTIGFCSLADEIEILEQKNEWIKILNCGLIGWIVSDTVLIT